MEYIAAIILGIVQGVTEFLPVSSSGHLIILHDWFNFQVANELAFDVALHVGTFIALLVFFAKELIDYIKRKDKILLYIIIGCLPAGIVGFLLEDIIDQYLRTGWIVALMLILVGGLFIYIEKVAKQNKELSALNWRSALAIGAAQIIALIPGTSRSGITTVMGMQLGLKRTAAVRFSFLISLPIFAGAALKQCLDFSTMNLNSSEYWVMGLGLISSAVTGYFCVKYLLIFFRKYSLKTFAYYRFALAAIIIIYLTFKIT